MRYIEVKRDLFSIPQDYIKAHCISRDCAMGKGIAVEFIKRNECLKEHLLSVNPQIGQAIPYINPLGEVTYNLITKDKYWNKPTYATFNQSIDSLVNEMVSNNYFKLAIPLIGSGLDRLSWEKNREYIKRAFAETNIDIVVCVK